MPHPKTRLKSHLFKFYHHPLEIGAASKILDWTDLNPEVAMGFFACVLRVAAVVVHNIDRARGQQHDKISLNS